MVELTTRMCHSVVAVASLLFAFNASAQLFHNTVADPLPKTADAISINAVETSIDTVNTASASALNHYIRNTKTLTGRFTQLVYSNRGEQRSSGAFWLKKPGKFFWDYQQPNAQKIISDGSKVYHYDLDLEQISIRPREELSGDVMMNLLVGNKKINEAFNVVPKQAAQAPTLLRFDEQGLLFYHLTPLQQSDNIDTVWVVMRRNQLFAVYVDTGMGQQTLIVLTNVKENEAISDAKFAFTPPAGVDVIGQ